ncbi:hypothetical protein DH2020_035460 [Rehmannia glutinosa]|uniref:AP2/ERF domain-containing protein n=1 Tax=Rehmannia glutinosa TaxID=99300 RepID=A0ABR0VA10_REHGL
MESNTYYGDFQSPLSVMPLKSDGSLCIMEALSKSHPQDSSPKLEDFLGGATMSTTHQRDDAIVGLDSAFYNQVQFYDHQTQFVGGFPYIQELEHQFANNSNMVENEMEGHDELKSLSLSMSPGSQSSCVTKITSEINVAMKNKKRGSEKFAQKQTVHRKCIDTFGQRTSQYRGVTRWTGRYEAHLWDNSCKKEGQTRKGRQGGYDMEEKAARAYDLAALKYWGPPTHINFPLENYHQELEEMKNMSRQEYVAHLRRRSSGFSRGASIYRGIINMAGGKLGLAVLQGTRTFTLELSAHKRKPPSACDVAAIKFAAPTPSLISTCPDTRRQNHGEQHSAHRAKSRGVKKDSDQPDTALPHNSCPVPDHQNQQNVTMPSLDDYQNPSISVALHDLITSSPKIAHESTNHVAPHFSNPSSLVTSLSSSREASPDRNGGTFLFAKPDSWIPAAQTSNVPVFASWTGVTRFV